MSAPSRAVKFHIKRGDLVAAITGEDAVAGKTGKVLKVLRDRQRVIVEGFNFVKKHVRKSQDNPKGGIVEKEASLAISNLKLAEETKAKPAPKPRAPRKKS